MLKAFIKETPFAIALLLIAAAIGFLALVVPIAGNKALIVRSGSMQPTIGVGDLITVRPQPTYKVGDVIAFKDAIKSSVVVTHRIIGKEEQGGKIYFKTKGDGNENADFKLIPAENIIGRADTAIPAIGKVIAFTKTNIGFSLVVIFPAFLVIVFEILNIIKEIRKQKKVVRTSSFKSLTPNTEVEVSPDTAFMFPMIGVLNPPKISRSGLGLKFQDLRVVLPILASLTLVYSTFAFFSDTETSTGNVFQAADSFGPPIAQTLVINEVLPDSSCFQGQTEAQWLELYNGFSTDVNLKNFKITDGTNTIDLVQAASVTAPAGGFVLLAHSTAIFGNGKCYQDNGTTVANLGGQLNIDTGFLQLLDASNNIVDTVQWGGATGLNPTQNQSIERVPTGIDSATGANFNSSDFIVREMPTPGYGTNLLLNEFIPNPQLTFIDEWVEIYNPSGSAVNLSGWTLKDIASSARSLTSLGSVDSLNRVIFDDSGDGWLNNTGIETLKLIDNLGRIIDQHTYSGTSNDVSIGRETDAGNLWKNCSSPTKNATNNGGC